MQWGINMAEVTIKISKDGDKVEVDSENFVGESCMNITDKIAGALGSITDSDKKPEYYQQGNNHIGG